MTVEPHPAARTIGPARAWYAVGLLVLLYCISFTDRLILALIAAPISQALHASDTQIGLLFGAGFGVLYAIIGLPIAQLIDRSHRVRIIAVGALLWGACTVASGFAANFHELVIYRSGVAIGEAVLSPAAISIIADMYARDKRILPTTVYTSVGTFMGAGAFVVGGFALDIAQLLSAHFPMDIWRLALVIVGLPAALLAPVLLLTVREPARIADARGGEFATAREAWTYVVSERRLYGCLFVGMAAYCVAVFSFQAWTPTLVIRGYGTAPQTVGYLFGTIGTIAGVAGAFLVPAIIALSQRAGRKDMPILLLCGGVGLATASVFVTGAVRLEPIVFATVAGLYFFGAVGSLVPPLIVQLVTPSRMRARIIAGNYLAANLIGLGVGPALTAYLGEHVFHGPFALGMALTAVTAVCCPLAAIAVWLSRSAYVRALDTAEAREAPVVAG